MHVTLLWVLLPGHFQRFLAVPGFTGRLAYAKPPFTQSPFWGAALVTALGLEALAEPALNSVTQILCNHFGSLSVFKIIRRFLYKSLVEF